METLGWISIHRKLKEHWLWQDPVKLKWWLDILLSVNHSDAKVNIGYQLFECKRGQSIKSLQKWGEGWGVTKDTARNFLKLLEKDGMITMENLSKTTRLTVCKYDSYQTSLHTEPTPEQRKPNAKPTRPHANNKENKKDNENKDNNLSLHQSAIAAFCDDYKVRFKTAYVVNGGKDGTAIKALLKKIEAKTTESGIEPTHENILTGLTHYLKSITDKWVIDNYSIALINSKFNELFKTAKNGNKPTNSGISAYLELVQERGHF
jgi:hypothetical protein